MTTLDLCGTEPPPDPHLELGPSTTYCTLVWSLGQEALDQDFISFQDILESKQSCVSTAVSRVGDQARLSLKPGLAVGHNRQQSTILWGQVGGTSPTAATSKVAGRPIP